MLARANTYAPHSRRHRYARFNSDCGCFTLHGNPTRSRSTQLAWRAAIGGWNAWTSKSGSMMLGFPEWIVYCGIVPALALTAAIGFMQAVRGFGPEVTE